MSVDTYLLQLQEFIQASSGAITIVSVIVAMASLILLYRKMRQLNSAIFSLDHSLKEWAYRRDIWKEKGYDISGLIKRTDSKNIVHLKKTIPRERRKVRLLRLQVMFLFALFAISAYLIWDLGGINLVRGWLGQLSA